MRSGEVYVEGGECGVGWLGSGRLCTFTIQQQQTQGTDFFKLLFQKKAKASECVIWGRREVRESPISV
jgi:hypothetical protein